MIFFSQSVSSEEAAPVFELSAGSIASSDNGVYPIRGSSEGDDVAAETGSEDGEASDARDVVFVEPQVNLRVYHFSTNKNVSFL